MHRAIGYLVGLFLTAGTASADGYDTVRAALDVADYDTAYATLAEMGDGGDTLAMIMLSNLQMSEVPNQPGLGPALAWLAEAAERGNIHAMLQLGAIYQTEGQVLFPEREVAVSFGAAFPEAVEWYRRAVAAGSAIGLSRLALIHRLGVLSGNEVMPVDEEQALAREMMEHAVEAGRADAMSMLGIALRRNDPTRAAELLLRAASLGDPSAIGIIAVRPEEAGITDPVEALAWLYAAKIAWELDRNPLSPLFLVAGAVSAGGFIGTINELIAEAPPELHARAEERAAELSAGWVSHLPGSSGERGEGGGLFGRN